MNRNLAIPNQTAVINPCLFNGPVMRPIAQDDMAHGVLEDFIIDAYKTIFNAELNSFLPNLVASTTQTDKICAAFGYSDASQNRLFLENYLDQPVESLLSKNLGRKISRNKIVEVGNLAITSMTDSVTFLRDIARYLQSLGYEWIVCTATRYLRLLFLRSGSKPFSIATASVARVKDDGTDWGSYYATAPEILVGNVNQSIYLIEQKLHDKPHESIQKTSYVNFSGV